MDNLEKRRVLKGVFAKKDDRKLLFFYRYYLEREPISPEYLAELLDLKAEATRRKLHSFEQMGLVERAGSEAAHFRFAAPQDQRLSEMLEEFFESRSSDYEEMARVFSAAEVRSFLGAELEAGS